MEFPDPAESDTSNLTPCGICGRTFRPDALTRHQKVCEKNAAKKRKVFDSSKQRAVEDAPKVGVRPSQRQPPSKAKAPANKVASKTSSVQGKIPKTSRQPELVAEKPKPKSNWREKHEELIETIKRARNQDLNQNTVETDTKKKVPSDYVQCPACERHFNQRAAERHIPWCQKKKAETPKSPAVDEAKEKLIARVKYRPPQGKSRLQQQQHQQQQQQQKTNTIIPAKSSEKKPPVHAQREKASRSSPPNLLDNRNSRTNSLDRVNNNLTQTNIRRRSGSRSREKEPVSSPELPIHIIKFKERFPNRRSKRNVDLEETLTSEQLRELLSVSRVTDRCPKKVPGVRFSGGHLNNRNDNWNYRSDNISRSASSSGGSSNSWNKRSVEKPTLPEVSGSELPGTWMGKLCWNGDLDHSMSSTGSSGSSSNGSLPPLSREGNEDAPLNFYCHQCSSKFPLIAAKYCCECGAKRRGPICINQTG